MDNKQTIDLIIVGAGPAGLSTGMHLVQDDDSWGQRMLVLEKECHPRSKLCGGGVTRSGLRTLKELGFMLPLPIPQERVEHVLLQYKDRTIHVRGKPQFVVYHRPEFDHFLAQTAQEKKVRIHENEAVLSLEMKPDYIQVNSSKNQYRARVVVGADSARGPVRAWLRSGAKRNSGAKRIGRTLEVLTPAVPTSPRFKQHSAIFDFSNIQENLQGYFWDFPSKVAGAPTHNRGIYDARFVHQRPRAKLPTYLDKGLVSIGAEPGEGEVKSTPIHWFGSSQLISGPRVLLVGDAAGVDGLFGEGISPALAYGKIAAAEIQRAFKNEDFSFEGYRRRVLRSPLGRLLFFRSVGAAYVYYFGEKPGALNALWTVGQILARIWRAGPLD